MAPTIRLIALHLVVLFAFACAREQVTLNLAGGAEGHELEMTVAASQRFMQRHPHIRVNVVPIPATTTDRLEYYQQVFDGELDRLDVLQVDVIWPGIIEEHAVDLTDFLSEADLDGHFPGIIESLTVNGRLVAMPWFADAPSLFYRSDLLAKYGYAEPPQTWDELEEMATRIMEGERQEGNLGFWGYVWQGRPYEGLTCNALEWQYSHGGGNFVTADGRPNLANSEAISGFRRAATWIGRISPPETLTFAEDEARLMWQRGDAAFLRNWAYVYSLARDDPGISDKFEVASLPGGPRGTASTLGGWHLMVSRYSSQPEHAAELVRFLSSAPEQKIRAIEGSFSPTIPALYQDPEVLEAAPIFRGFERTFKNLVLRPSAQTGAGYMRISQEYWEAVYDVLNGYEAKERLLEAEESMRRILAPN